MPIDVNGLRRAADRNDAVTDNVKNLSEKIKKVDGRNYEETCGVAKSWSANIKDLKASLGDQKSLTKDMREGLSIQEQQHNDLYKDSYRFLVERLKADIRYYFHALPNFLDLPQDFGNQRTWDHCAHDMETGIKAINANGSESGFEAMIPVVQLLNYRDEVIALLMNGLLFQAAVLHWDMHSMPKWASAPMVEMYEKVVDMVSKTETVHHKLESMPPNLNAKGTFTYDQKKMENQAQPTTELSPLQCRLISLLQEMQMLDRGLRNLKFGDEVSIPDDMKKGEGNKIVAADSLRGEVTKWHLKCLKLENDLTASKAQRHAPLEQQVEILSTKHDEKEMLYRQEKSRTLKLEGELQSKLYENNNLKREKAELAEKNARMMKENVPVLDKIERQLGKSNESVDRLNADAELLSAMFQLQVEENKKNIKERNEISQELGKVRGHLSHEKQKSKFKDDELSKKETLYLRTMAARKSIQEAYLEQKAKITEVEDKMRQRELDWQELLKVMEGRDSEIRQLKTDLRRASARIDELEQQKKIILDEFRKATGRSCNALLEGFTVNPTVPSSQFDS